MPPGGSPPLQGGGAESEVARKWARWPHNPCCLGGPHRFTARRGAESQAAHKWAKRLHNPCRMGGSPRLQSGGQNQRWPTMGQGGYITIAA